MTIKFTLQLQQNPESVLFYQTLHSISAAGPKFDNNEKKKLKKRPREFKSLFD